MSSENQAPPAQHLSIFGSRIIGAEAARHFENPQTMQSTVFGSRVTGARVSGEVTAPPPGALVGAALTGSDADRNADGLVSIAEMRDTLQADAAALDGFIAAETAKPKPRKGAVALFREVEEAKPEAERRTEVLAELDRLSTLAAA